MNDFEALASPCIGVCIMDGDNGYCRGCYRTMVEISSWLLFSPAERAQVHAAIARRRDGEDDEHPTPPPVIR